MPILSKPITIYFFHGDQLISCLIFIAWLNLDLGVETCFIKGLNAYYKILLQFVFPFYIWNIAGLIIILSKYSSRVAKVMGNNCVPVLATLFLLSYAKLFRTIISALSYTILYTSDGRKAVWSADGNVDYLSPKHMFLFVVAVASMLFLWLPYTLILFLGQWLHICNYRLIVLFLFKIKPFLDAHYSPLKDKHRYWFGALHLVRAAIFLVSALIPADHSSIVTINILVSAAVLMYFGSIVYQKTVVAMFNMGFLLNLILITGTTLNTQIVGGDSRVYAYLLTGLALLQFVGLLIFKMYSILKNVSKYRACIQVCMRQQVEDDWELFEQAALLGERESESEEEGSDIDEKSVNIFSTDLFILTTHYFWYYRMHIYSNKYIYIYIYISEQLLLVYIIYIQCKIIFTPVYFTLYCILRKYRIWTLLNLAL